MLKTIWEKIDEPRIHRILVSVKYILAIGLGIEYFFVGVDRVSHPGLFWACIFAGAFITIGSILGAFFALSKRWIWERPALILAGLGAAISLFITSFSSINFDLFLGQTTLYLVFMYIVALLDRYIEIYNDDVEVTQEEIEREADGIFRHPDL